MADSYVCVKEKDRLIRVLTMTRKNYLNNTPVEYHQNEQIDIRH